MKNSLRRIFALALVVMMIAALGMSAAAADDTTITGGTDAVYTINNFKVLTKEGKAYAPVADFVFSIAPASDEPTAGVKFVGANADGNLVIGNLLNAAHAVGVDSCYIYRAKEVFASDEGKELMKEWGLDEKYVGIGNCLLGYAAAEAAAPAPRKDDYIVYVR